ncbi:nuclear transport factor 2 family protein [uncultured Mucilaginibacter sp.]|uniref:nuclear transport factor 2 family protein n=1 Tax=uncultured Mucilaginibacter sp. TaxID=797541 RepID=UPI0025E7A75F|nr:nuclear transport factor 2 family protein [uncultured Mucilaginibacter sp.]
MKTLKTTILGLLMLVAFGAAKANVVKLDDSKLTVNYAVNTYVDAVSLGNYKELSSLLDDNLKYSIERGNKTLVFNKAQLLESFKQEQGVKQDCEVSTSVNDSTPDVTIVKVEMKYADFTRTNYVTLVNSAKGWKITNIYSSFK